MVVVRSRRVKVARLEKISLLAELLGRLEPDEIPVVIGFLTGLPRQGRLGIGWASPNDGDLDTALTLAESRLESDLAANA